MNQIIANAQNLKMPNSNYQVEFSNEMVPMPYENNINKHTFLKKWLTDNKYRLQFFLSFGIALFFLFIFFYHVYQSNQKEKISAELLKNYTLTTLYQNNSSYGTPQKASSYVIKNPFVIGMIRIEKLNLNYPILSESNKELLQVSVCRFAGPMPNEVGNLCIAGHNYVDNKFFSKLTELDENDEIEIYDLSGKKIVYSVIKKFEVEQNDFSCTNQNTQNEKIVTLLTCNNVNGKRVIIQAKAINES